MLQLTSCPQYPTKYDHYHHIPYTIIIILSLLTIIIRIIYSSVHPYNFCHYIPTYCHHQHPLFHTHPLYLPYHISTYHHYHPLDDTHPLYIIASVSHTSKQYYIFLIIFSPTALLSFTVSHNIFPIYSLSYFHSQS